MLASGGDDFLDLDEYGITGADPEGGGTGGRGRAGFLESENLAMRGGVPECEIGGGMELAYVKPPVDGRDLSAISP